MELAVQKERKERSGSGTDPHLVKSHLIFAPSLIFPLNYSCPLYCKVLIYTSRGDVRVVLMDDVLAPPPPLLLFLSSPPVLVCRLLRRGRNNSEIKPGAFNPGKLSIAHQAPPTKGIIKETSRDFFFFPLFLFGLKSVSGITRLEIGALRNDRKIGGVLAFSLSCSLCRHGDLSPF